MKYYQRFQEAKVYHVFARANGKEKMFISDNDYDLFIERMHKYIIPIADIYAFSLIPNHYHLMVKFKSQDELLAFAKSQKLNFKETDDWVNDLITRQFSNFQNSYCKKINYKYKRKGSLFIERLRRLEIKTDDQFTATVFYIHKNPVHHAIAVKIRDWPFSSYHQYLSDENCFVKTDSVLEHFGGMTHFINFHDQQIFAKESVELEN